MLSGHVFLDVNGDGIQQSGEPNLSGVGILIVDGLGMPLHATTDASGNYRTLVRVGSARVDVIDSTLPAGSVLTTGNDPQINLVGLGHGGMTSGVGYRPRAVPTSSGVSPTPMPAPAATPTASPTRPTATPTNATQECEVAGGPFEVAPSIEQVVTNAGELFFMRQLCITVERSVILAGAAAGDGSFIVDDKLVLDVEHADGTIAAWDYDWSAGCTLDDPPISPLDISALFLPGENRLTIRLYDACDHLEGTAGPILLSTGGLSGAVAPIMVAPSDPELAAVRQPEP
jgi:hypothetical protein